MASVNVLERVEHIAVVRADSSSNAAAIQSALVAVRQVTAWADAQQAVLVSRLSAMVVFPEAAMAAAAKSSLATAVKAKHRSDTLGKTPRLADALDDGSITAGHIDAITRGAHQLSDDQQSELFDRIDALAPVAAAATVDEFGRRVKLEIRRIQCDDGETRLARQQSATRLSTWTDDDGMWNVRGRFDPVTALRLSARLDHALEALFAEATPHRCPTDPIDKQKFLAAHALIRLIDGGGSVPTSGRPEYVAVIDADAPDQPGPVVDWPIPVEVPARVLAELAADADVNAIVVRNGVILHAPGELNLGRATRLANRAQRRALRGLYRGCAIPGCSVGFDRCKVHHIVWWRNGGRTDLDNLIPICTSHHTNIHQDDWIIQLGPHRALTLRLPDGTIHNTGPPSRRAA